VTVIEAIELNAARLAQAGVCFGHGTANAFDEAAWLVLWRLGLPLDDLDGVAQRSLDAAQLEAVNALVDERIASRKPAAYLTHEAWLQGVPFYVDERTIVPRSLIAEPLAEGVIDAWLDVAPTLASLAAPQGGAGRLGAAQRRPAAPTLASPAAPRGGAGRRGAARRRPREPQRVLDLCTGNGSLAVLAALAWPQAQVDASDLSPDALAVARINVDRHGLGERVTLLEGDGLAPARGRYDLILCNPPYVNARSMAALPPEYRAEPALALAGGDDGMDFVRALLRDAPRHLADDGVLVLEIGHERAHFEAAFPKLAVAWLPTSAGDDHVLLVTRQALA
jgi:ribosomal protein L3 glutamine methyltransferase